MRISRSTSEAGGRRSSAGGWALLAAAALAAGCGAGKLQLPPEPDLSALVAAYDHPTGTIDPAAIDAFRGTAQATLDRLQLVWLPDFLAGALTRLGDQLADSGISRDPNRTVDTKRPVIDAVVQLQRVCQGWSDPPGPPDPAANGQLIATAVVEDGVLRNTIEGAATRCQARVVPANDLVQSAVSSIDGFVDGTIDVYFYGPVPLEVGQTNCLVQIDGQVGVSGATVSGQFDFRVRYPDVDFRVSRPDGDVIVSVGLSGITVRAANLTLQCDAQLATCTQT
jgi:hypothetical protein